ncbi:MAG: four helix bundle protein [Deltaproteobacteria bacterium]|nr:MAG: four helix bundle protein [Deltaproteobacteria bacterium]
MVDEEDSRGQGFEDSSEMLKNYKELKVWQKSYQLCPDIYNKIIGKQTLESLNPRILYHFLPTNSEKNLK